MTRRSEHPLWLALWAIAAMSFSGYTSAQRAGGAAHEHLPATDAATTVVHRLHESLIGASALAEVSERFAALQEEITATHDLDYIGELTVRRQWREFTDAQRREFIEGFQALSVMTYAARFVGLDENSFAMHGAEESGDGRVLVRSGIVRADGSEVPLEYVLQDGTQGWRIVNVIADGVSDLALKRAEYRALLEQSGFDGLVGELQKQTENLAESAAR